jgi:hypothetical protein
MYIIYYILNFNNEGEVKRNFIHTHMWNRIESLTKMSLNYSRERLEWIFVDTLGKRMKVSRVEIWYKCIFLWGQSGFFYVLLSWIVHPPQFSSQAIHNLLSAYIYFMILFLLLLLDKLLRISIFFLLRLWTKKTKKKNHYHNFEWISLSHSVSVFFFFWKSHNALLFVPWRAQYTSIQ